MTAIRRTTHRIVRGLRRTLQRLERQLLTDDELLAELRAILGSDVPAATDHRTTLGTTEPGVR